MHAMRAPRRMASRSGARTACTLCRAVVLGEAAAGFRRSERAIDRRRARTRRARWEPNGSDLHRRPLWGVAVPRASPGRIREPADFGCARRRPEAEGLLRLCDRPLRAAGEQAVAL